MNQVARLQTKSIKFHVTERLLGDGKVRLEFRRWPQDLLPLFWSVVSESNVEAEIQKYQSVMQERENRDKEIARKLYGVLRPKQFDPQSPYEIYRANIETTRGVRWLLVEASSSEAARIAVQDAYPGQNIVEIATNWESDPALHIGG